MLTLTTELVWVIVISVTIRHSCYYSYYYVYFHGYRDYRSRIIVYDYIHFSIGWNQNHGY